MIPGMSQIQLHADCALNAMRDAGLKLSDIDGIACAGEVPTNVAHYLGLVPKWVDGTAVGGCSFMLHVRHATAAISAGLCKTVLITHGESGKSRIGALPRSIPPATLAGTVRSTLRHHGPADDVHDPGIALPQDLRRDAGAACDGRGRSARMGGEESACDDEGADHA